MPRRPSATAVLVVIALVIAGCAASGDDDDSTSVGDPSALLDQGDDTTDESPGASGETEPVESEAGPGQSPAGDPGPASEAQPPPAAAPGGTGAPSAPDSTTPASPRPEFAAAGTYVYDMKTDDGSFVVEQRVEPPEGSRQTTRIYQDGDEVGYQVLEFRADGVYLVELRQSEGGFTAEFKPEPPVLIVPAEPERGMTWSWTMTSTDGDFTVSNTSTFAGFERMTVGRVEVDTMRIDSESDISGKIAGTDFSGTQDGTMWVSPEESVVVKDESTTDGTFGAVPITFSQTSTLRSLTPA